MGEKQVTVEVTVYGGHDCEFVEAVSDRLNCNICTKVLRDPHLAVCCGQHFCESCLNQWFTRQGKESCPHCRSEGEDFHHVINKGVRSEINQLKIRCSNHHEGCQWTGELGALKQHLKSNSGCDFVLVECPNKCKEWYGYIEQCLRTSIMRRRDLSDHLTQFCYLRPYRCDFCGHKDTYEEVTGDSYGLIPRADEYDYYGHQAECPEAPVICPYDCGLEMRRKELDNHFSLCPQKPVECPFAEAGCRVDIRRYQLENHMTTSLQLHLMLLMIDHKQLKGELSEVKAQLSKAETKFNETELKLSKTETKLDEVKCKLSKAETEIGETKRELLEAKAHLTSELGADFNYAINKVVKYGDSVILPMRSFSKYRCSGKVWHSPPFYYREGYKMCLAVYANGVETGTGTHVSVAILHIKGEYDDQLKWPAEWATNNYKQKPLPLYDGCADIFVHRLPQSPADNEHVLIGRQVKFCSLKSKKILHLMNDCLTFIVKYEDCRLFVELLYDD